MVKPSTTIFYFRWNLEFFVSSVFCHWWRSQIWVRMWCQKWADVSGAPTRTKDAVLILARSAIRDEWTRQWMTLSCRQGWGGGRSPAKKKQLHKTCDAWHNLQHLGASINDVLKNFGFFWPRPLVRICNWFILLNSCNLLCLVPSSMTPLQCVHHIWRTPNGKFHCRSTC